MDESAPIQVTSHVSRDFLQNAAYFNTMGKIVWEYVANALDAAVEGTPAVVAVRLANKSATISDTGRGISREELRNFFQMHGENVQRQRGQRVRGRFGTGKSAAFGLANVLRIDTTQNCLRNVVELRRDDIEAAQGGDSFPVREIVVNEPASSEDGTTVRVSGLNVKNYDFDRVRAYVEKHLGRYRKRAHVTINDRVCEYREPPHVAEIVRRPPPGVAEEIGDVALTIKVSPVPLDADLRGIDLLSHGIWHETTLAGIDNRDRANYIFGSVDVPVLEDGEWPIPAFDNTRNNVLNSQNPVVAVLYGWLGQELEEVRLELVRRERERRASELALRLVDEAQLIAEVINDDFSQQELELELTRRVSTHRGKGAVFQILEEQGDGDGAGPALPRVRLFEVPATATTRGRGTQPSIDGDGDGGTAPRKAKKKRRKKRKTVVFQIDFEEATGNEPRSRYYADTRTIVINLEHPQIATGFDAGGKRTDSREFREVCYEVAAVEYALALQHERLRHEPMPADEALYEVRATINRVLGRFLRPLEG